MAGHSFVRVVDDWMTVSGDVWPIQQKGQAVSAARFAAVSFSYTPSSPNQHYRMGDELLIRAAVVLSHSTVGLIDLAAPAHLSSFLFFYMTTCCRWGGEIVKRVSRELTLWDFLVSSSRLGASQASGLAGRFFFSQSLVRDWSWHPRPAFAYPFFFLITR